MSPVEQQGRSHRIVVVVVVVIVVFVVIVGKWGRVRQKRKRIKEKRSSIRRV